MAVDRTDNKTARVTVSKAATEDVASFRTAVRAAVSEKLDVENERLASFAKFTSVLGSDCVEGGIVVLSPAGTVRGSTHKGEHLGELGEKSGGSKGVQSWQGRRTPAGSTAEAGPSKEKAQRVLHAGRDRQKVSGGAKEMAQD